MGNGSWVRMGLTGKVMSSTVHTEGWVSLEIPPEHEERAKRLRLERDLQYGNIYSVAKTDERWVGDLGEMAFKSWLRHEGIEDFDWILDGAAGQPDFVMTGGARVGVKTVKRKVPPRMGYAAQITARHAEEPVDQFFFLTYEIDRKRMWFLGAIDRGSFLRESRFYGAGEWVHPNYQVREGHEIYNIEIDRLVRPSEWIAQVATQT